MRRTAALIAGGGPAGAAAAIILARGGHKPLLIERQRETGDALCGGFLSWRSLERLERLGVMPQGHPVRRVRIWSERMMGEALLPGPAIGVSRRLLDAMLLGAAESAGAAIERGIAIRSATPDRVQLADGGAIGCDGLFLATGKHDCRGLARPHAGGDPALGLRIRLPGIAGLVGDAIELHLFRGGYAGLLVQEDGSANLCMAVRKSRLAEAGDPRALLAEIGATSPALGERLAKADLSAPIDAVGAVPYGWRATDAIPGLFRLGDQAAVIPSLAGEGMGIALASGVMAAEAWLAMGPDGAGTFQRELARRTARPVRTAGWLRDLAETRAGRALAPHLASLAPLMANLTRLP